MPYLDPSTLDKKNAYFLGISVITPRPIALITTLNEDQSVNAAPFSYFTGLSSQPALIAFSIANGRQGKKDTLKNILRDKDFVVHIPLKGMEEDVNLCAVDFPYGHSEITHTKFSLTDCRDIRGKRIEQIPAAMECTAIRFMEDLGNFTLVIAEVKNYYIDENYFNVDTKTFDFHKTAVLGRMGGNDFVYADEMVTIPHLSYKDWLNKQS